MINRKRNENENEEERKEEGEKKKCYCLQTLILSLFFIRNSGFNLSRQVLREERLVVHCTEEGCVSQLKAIFVK